MLDDVHYIIRVASHTAVRVRVDNVQLGGRVDTNSRTIKFEKRAWALCTCMLLDEKKKRFPIESDRFSLYSTYYYKYVKKEKKKTIVL